VIALGGTFWHGWKEILSSLATGKTGFDKAHGMPLFEYLHQHPVDASFFNEAMIGFHGDEPVAVARAYDFSAFKTVVDVGGGTGNLLAAILSSHSRPRGWLSPPSTARLWSNHVEWSPLRPNTVGRAASGPELLPVVADLSNKTESVWSIKGRLEYTTSAWTRSVLRIGPDGNTPVDQTITVIGCGIDFGIVFPPLHARVGH